MTEENFNICEHMFVPEHIKLTAEEKQEFLKQIKTEVKKIPKILKSDPAIKELQPETGDIIKIIRKSPTTGKSVFYRRVING